MEDANKEVVKQEERVDDGSTGNVVFVKTPAVGQTVPAKEIIITEQPDGNWKGKMYRFGGYIEVRQSDPQIVLQMLITHP